MKNMKKKGFTLIELLAVILILGIIALIAIPTVNKIIEESKRGAFKTSVENIIRAVEQECQIQQLKEQAIIDKYTFENGKVKTFRAEKLENATLNVKGDLPKSGTIKVNDSCSVSIDEDNPLSDGTFVANTKDGNITVAKTGEKVVYNVYNAGDPIYYNPIDNVKCTETEELEGRTGEYDAVEEIGMVAGNCKKWYVIETEDNNKKGTIDVILNHGIGIYYWEPEDASYKESNIKAVLDTLILPVSSGGKGWNANLNPRLISADEIAKITGADREDTIKWSSSKQYVSSLSADINTQMSTYYLDGGKNTNKTSYSKSDGWNKQYANENVKSDYYWLYDNLSGCTRFGCNQEELGEEEGDAFLWSHYWIDINNNLSGSASVLYYGKLDFGVRGIEGEIRPVITISKDLIS